MPEPARRRRPGILLHRAVDLTPVDITTVDGIRVTTVARTLRDLSTVLSVKELNRRAARAEREGLIDAAEFPELVARHGSRAGAPVLRAALLADGGVIMIRSEAEEVMRALADEHALPRPRVNAEVEGHEVDFYWPDARMVIEVDGFEHHKLRGSFENDRQRDLELEAKGITVLRVTWRHLVEKPKATAGLIVRAFGHAEALAGLRG